MIYHDLRHLVQTECNRLKTILHHVNGATFQPRKFLQIVPQGDWMLLKWIQLIKWSGDVIGELPNDDPELKKDIISYSTILSEDVITSAENRISSWLKLKKIIALFLVYKQKLFKSVKTNKEPSREIHKSCKEKLIGLREIQIAAMKIIRSVPSRYFGKEIALLSKHKKSDVNNKIFKIDPYIDAQGVLRVGGRTRKSLVQQGIQHPILLPKDCRITNLIVSWCHGQVAHADTGITINQVRMSGFWFIGLNIVVRSMISKYVRCKHLRGRLQQ